MSDRKEVSTATNASGGPPHANLSGRKGRLLVHMASEAPHEAGTTDEAAALEQKVADLRVARAQMVAERDEHVRDAARAAAVLADLALVHHEIGMLANERAAVRDAAVAAREAATAGVARVRTASEAANAQAWDLERRLAGVRETGSRLSDEGDVAERAAADADAAERQAAAQYEETARAAAEMTRAYEAALTQASIARGRDVQYDDIEETLDREESLAQTRLCEAHLRAETVRVEAELQRVRELQGRLTRERADIERRLRSIRTKAEVATSTTPLTLVAPRELHAPRGSVSLAMRLRRDLATPSATA